MQDLHAQRAIAAATVSLVVFGACVAAFLPPLNQIVLASVPYIVIAGLALAGSFILHLVFIGLAAQRLRRSVTWWVVVAVLTFPVGSIVGLVLFEWFVVEAPNKPMHGVA